jgi:hypothetical protein
MITRSSAGITGLGYVSIRCYLREIGTSSSAQCIFLMKSSQNTLFEMYRRASGEEDRDRWAIFIQTYPYSTTYPDAARQGPALPFHFLASFIISAFPIVTIP